MSPTNLPPAKQPLCIWNQFLAQQTETVILKEKMLSLSCGSFDITLENGQPLLRVQGSALSLSGRKSVFDATAAAGGSTHLFDIVKEHMHLHSTYAAVEPADGGGKGRKLLEVRSKESFLGSKATATFTNTLTNQQDTLAMKGNWLDSAAEIVDERTGAVAARIDRRLFSGREVFFGQQTYALVVAPGVDIALMAALCICLAEKNNERETEQVLHGLS